jgi:sulfoxide reductase catalytic subunit YedY
LDEQKSDLLDRRRFLKRLGGILLGGAAILAGCGVRASRAPQSPSPVTGASPGPTERAWRWLIRWIRGTPQVDPQEWRLLIDGLVDTRRLFSLDDLRALPQTTLRLRMKCVECWSAPAEWGGVAGRDLLAQVRPLEGAGYVTLHALDGYTSTLSVEELTADRVIFVLDMDDQELPAEHGYPLRLIAPAKYGYKSVKAIERLEFVDSHIEGYWEQRGYSNEGTVQPGLDHPLDLGGSAREIGRGEITDY